MNAVRAHSLVDQVRDEIRARLAAGAYPSGEPIAIAATAKDLGVSATPVREAFARLAAEGLLTFSANLGYRVAPGPSAEDYTNWAVARIVVESNALHYILGPIDARLLDEAAAINDEIRRTRFGKDAAGIRRYSELNWAFHAKLLALARNATLCDLHARLYAAPQFARIFLGRGIPNKARVVAEHDAILAQLRQGRCDAAAAALREHIACSLERDARLADVALSLQRVVGRKPASTPETVVEGAAMKSFTRIVVAACAALVVTAAAAQPYPSRPVTLVVGFPPGGGVDIVARQLADKLAGTLGQPVVVENKAGAAGNVAMDFVAHAKPDGYTLLMGNLGMLSANPALYAKLTFDPAKDFVPVARVVVTPLVAVVPAALPVTTLAELVTYAKARPGELNFGSGGTGNINHLAGELFNMQTGTRIQHVPYKGSAPAMADLVGGRIQLVIDGANVVQPFVTAGTARALAMTGEARSPSQPSVPTAREAGLPDFVIYGWQGVLAPTGTPQAVIDQLNAAIGKALADPALASKLSSQGTQPAFTSAAKFGEFIKAEQKRWGDVIRTANIKLE